MSSDLGFIAGIKREIRRMGSRRMYLFGMILVPLFVAFFFLSLLGEGLPEQVPTAVVDLDHSPMSRSVTRSLKAVQVLDISQECESYDDALKAVREGEIFGFFVIPANFEKDAFGGRTPTLEYYSNMTYFVPGTLAFKGFKTVAVGTAAGVVRQVLSSMGLSSGQVSELVQPLVIDQFPIGNPWMNYAIYLCPDFVMCTLVLMIMFMTVFAITMEIKQYTSRQWLATSHGNILVAVVSKLLPHTIVFEAVAVFLFWLLFGYSHFPLNGSAGWMLAATMLLVPAAQGFALFVCSCVPNPRLSLIICALFGILSFSFVGFSFPVQDMYGYIGVFSWLAPIRYWFLIYINEALNGVDLYYSRYWFVALIIFPFVGMSMLHNLRKACLNPVYVP